MKLKFHFRMSKDFSVAPDPDRQSFSKLHSLNGDGQQQQQQHKSPNNAKLTTNQINKDHSESLNSNKPNISSSQATQSIPDLQTDLSPIIDHNKHISTLQKYEMQSHDQSETSQIQTLHTEVWPQFQYPNQPKNTMRKFRGSHCQGLAAPRPAMYKLDQHNPLSNTRQLESGSAAFGKSKKLNMSASEPWTHFQYANHPNEIPTIRSQPFRDLAATPPKIEHVDRHTPHSNPKQPDSGSMVLVKQTHLNLLHSESWPHFQNSKHPSDILKIKSQQLKDSHGNVQEKNELNQHYPHSTVHQQESGHTLFVKPTQMHASHSDSWPHFQHSRHTNNMHSSRNLHFNESLETFTAHNEGNWRRGLQESYDWCSSQIQSCRCCFTRQCVNPANISYCQSSSNEYQYNSSPSYVQKSGAQSQVSDLNQKQNWMELEPKLEQGFIRDSSRFEDNLRQCLKSPQTSLQQRGFVQITQSQNHLTFLPDSCFEIPIKLEPDEAELLASAQALMLEHKSRSSKDNYYRSNFLSLRSQMSSILDAFTITTGKVCLNTELTHELILNHQKQKPIEKTTLMSHLSCISSALQDFAMSQYLFSSLSKQDQNLLLNNNIPLYIQYILARYFSAETGLEQLNWITEGQIYLDSIEVVTSLSRISLKEYNNSANILPSLELVELFSQFSANIGMFYPFPEHCNGLIANMILYQIDDNISSRLQEKKRIGCIFEEAKALVRMGFDTLDRTLDFNPSNCIAPLIHTLQKMKSIFGSSQLQNQGEELNKYIPSSIVINYSDNEDSWIQQVFNQFETAYASVGPSQDLVDDLISLLEVGKPVSVNFMPSWIEMTTERVYRVLKSHPEFTCLPERAQQVIWLKNNATATSLAAIQMENLTTGKDQVKHIMGYLNTQNDEWENDFRHMTDLDSLECSYLHKAELNLGKWDESSLKCYFDIFNDISHMCSNDHKFQLFTLLVLLDLEDLPHSPCFGNVLKARQIYLKIVQRKMMSQGSSFNDYSYFRKALKKVRIFASLMQKIVN